MPLPTRRAVRPDSKHIRDARRQRLTRAAQSKGARGFWMIVAILSLAGLIVSGAAESLTAVQVQQNHFMAEFRVARNRPGAAAFRVARMTARNDYLEGVSGGL